MIVYKLTEADLTDDTNQYVVGVPSAIRSGQGDLTGPGWMLAYEHPLLAVFHNPSNKALRARNRPPPPSLLPILGAVSRRSLRLFRANAPDSPVLRDGQLMIGVTQVTLVGELALPTISLAQRVRYAIYCAQTGAALPGWRWDWVEESAEWRSWAESWLNGTNRSVRAARSAEAASASPAARCAATAARWASEAANEVAYRRESTHEAQWARDAAREAAEWTIRIARRASDINLIDCAIRAVADETANL